MQQVVIHHTSAGPRDCDGGQKEHAWEDVSYETYGTIRITRQVCRSCKHETKLRNDGLQFILRVGVDFC